MPPRGVNTPANSPSVIYAKAKLTIHKNAWDRSPAIATIEKGREMRSYGKTGRWHRVVVPSTNIIGWVHEDQLIGGHNKPDSATLITGSVAKRRHRPRPRPLMCNHTSCRQRLSALKTSYLLLLWPSVPTAGRPADIQIRPR